MGDLIQLIRARDLDGLRTAIAANPAAARHAHAVGEAGRLAWQPDLEALEAAGADLNAAWRNYRPLHALLQEDPHTAACEPAPDRLSGLDACPRRRSRATWGVAVGSPAYIDLLIQGGARVDGFAASALGDRQRGQKTIRADPAFPLARDHGGLTALQCAAGSRMPGADTLAIARLLLDSGADVAAQTRSWSRMVGAVYFVVGTKNLAVFNLLLDHGADPTPALSSALWAGAYKLAESALAHGANPDQAQANGKPLLNDLICWGQIPQTPWLLERHASPNIPDSRGWTAVHQAASRGNGRLLRAVLAAGGHTHFHDKQGNTPADLARSEKMRALISSAAGSPPAPAPRWSAPGKRS